MAEELAASASASGPAAVAVRGAWPGRREAVRYLIGLAAGALILVLLAGKRSELADAWRQLRSVQVGWLLAAMAAEAASLGGYAWLQRHVLRLSSASVPLPGLVLLTLANEAIANTVPGEPVVSSAYRFRYYQRRGVSAASAGWTIFTILIAQAIGMSLLLLVGVLVAVAASTGVQTAGAAAAGLLIIALALTVLIRRDLVLRAAAALVRVPGRRLTSRPHADLRPAAGLRPEAGLGPTHALRPTASLGPEASLGPTHALRPTAGLGPEAALTHSAGLDADLGSGATVGAPAALSVRIETTLLRMREIPLGAVPAAGVVAIAAGVWFADFACLACSFGAVHAAIPWHGVLLAYGVAQVVGSLPLVPGGLGLIEGSLAVILAAYGTSRVQALSVALAYRLVSFWLAITIGWLSVAAITLLTRRSSR